MGKSSQPIATTQVLGRLSEIPGKPGVGDPPLGSSPFARGVDQRGGRPLGLHRLPERLLPEDRGRAEGLGSRGRSAVGGLGDDRPDQLGDPLSVLLDREMSPAGQGVEFYNFGRRELACAELLAAEACSPFSASIKPGSLDRLAG